MFANGQNLKTVTKLDHYWCFVATTDDLYIGLLKLRNHCIVYLKKPKKIIWSDDCNSAFEILKNKTVESRVLAHPDFKGTFILDTDACDVSIGAVMSQNTNGQVHVIAYASRTLTKSERRYCITKKELLAIVYFVKYFRHYLYGKAFTIKSDHGSLRWLMNLYMYQKLLDQLDSNSNR